MKNRKFFKHKIEILIFFKFQGTWPPKAYSKNGNFVAACDVDLKLKAHFLQ